MINTTEEKQPDDGKNNPNQHAYHSAFPTIEAIQAGRQQDQLSTTSAGNPKVASEAVEAHFQMRLDDMKAEMQ
eukprot:1516922-Ditylum_brightwellii.AAC.1